LFSSLFRRSRSKEEPTAGKGVEPGSRQDDKGVEPGIRQDAPLIVVSEDSRPEVEKREVIEVQLTSPVEAEIGKPSENLSIGKECEEKERVKEKEEHIGKGQDVESLGEKVIEIKIETSDDMNRDTNTDTNTDTKPDIKTDIRTDIKTDIKTDTKKRHQRVGREKDEKKQNK